MGGLPICRLTVIYRADIEDLTEVLSELAHSLHDVLLEALPDMGGDEELTVFSGFIQSWFGPLIVAEVVPDSSLKDLRPVMEPKLQALFEHWCKDAAPQLERWGLKKEQIQLRLTFLPFFTPGPLG